MTIAIPQAHVPPPWAVAFRFFLALGKISLKAFVSRGFQISVFPVFPGVLRLATVAPRDSGALSVFHKEIDVLISKNVIGLVSDHPFLCLSPFFVIP